MTKSLERPIICILAITNRLGIGKNGALPWLLSKDMKFFKRVTIGRAEQAKTNQTEEHANTRKEQANMPKEHSNEIQPDLMNAVIMGRRSWESIPFKFKPLRDRINVVITSDPSKVFTQPVARLHAAKSLQHALEILENNYSKTLHNVFVIGGAQVYETAFKDPRTKHIVVTRVLDDDIDCDTFLKTDFLHSNEWKQESHAAFEKLVETDVPEGNQIENDITFRFELYSRTYN